MEKHKLSFTYDPTALSILMRLREAGHESYFCGGCVRDALMDRKPKDWDITTSATPDEVEGLFEKTVAVGKAFGVMVVVENEEEYEVATFRADGEYSDGRRPESVRFCQAEEDVRRRDFTMNALLFDPEKEEVIDYVGGCADIRDRIVRTVGEAEKRFMEDHLRLLRAIRFAARTGFTLEDKTREAIGKMAGLVRTVSAERTGMELVRMLTEGYSHAAFTMLCDTNLLLHCLPELEATRAVPQPPQFHPEGDVFSHTMIMLELLDKGCGQWSPASQSEKEVLGFAALLHDIGKPLTITVSDRIRFNEHDRLGSEMAEEVLTRLKRPRKVIDTVKDMIGRHIHFSSLTKMRKSKLVRFLREEAFPLHLELHRLDCEASHGILDTYDFGLAKWREEMSKPPQPEPLLTGKNLMTLGYRAGPKMGEILNAVEDARLEGVISSSKEAVAWVGKNYPL